MTKNGGLGMCVWQPLSVAVRAPHDERSSEAHRGLTGGALGPDPDPAPDRSRSQHRTLRSPLVVRGGSGSLRLVCAGLGPAAAYHTGSVANKKTPHGVGSCLCASLLMQCQIRIFHPQQRGLFWIMGWLCCKASVESISPDG